MNKSESFYQKIYRVVKQIPNGKVATYGQIAALAGHPRGAQMVGWALHILNDKKLKTIPWHRVINREGRISTTCFEHTADLQRYLLTQEGVEIKIKDNNFWIDLKKFLWYPLFRM